jgi:hypothetical protein
MFLPPIFGYTNKKLGTANIIVCPSSIVKYFYDFSAASRPARSNETGQNSLDLTSAI